MKAGLINRFYKRKRILVTGACGTVGYELTRQLLEQYPIQELIAVDNNESELFFLEKRFSKFKNVRFFLADIRDREKMVRLSKGIHILFHTAAFKHVILCERSPFEAVQTNILGVQNIISAAIENDVERVIFTSSDKAVNPTNVMGTSKLMAERLMTAANTNLRGNGPIFTSTRFGNVLGSRGSVIPLFREQIKSGGPLTLTDPQMTRFIMSIQEAVHLVISSAFLALGGEVFITKMPVIWIKDLASIMIKELAGIYGYTPEKIKIKIIGPSPGEKMFEELMNTEETRRAWELDRYFVVLPAFQGSQRNTPYRYSDLVTKTVTNPYQSNIEPALDKKELAVFLKNNHLLEEE
jgi:FlaA1/EpsC-like NDP-sugar epimerase